MVTPGKNDPRTSTYTLLFFLYNLQATLACQFIQLCCWFRWHCDVQMSHLLEDVANIFVPFLLFLDMEWNSFNKLLNCAMCFGHLHSNTTSSNHSCLPLKVSGFGLAMHLWPFPSRFAFPPNFSFVFPCCAGHSIAIHLQVI